MELATVKQIAKEWYAWLVDQVKQKPVIVGSIAAVFTGAVVVRFVLKRRRKALITDGMSDEEKSELAVLITGCDTGFGKELAIKLSAMGLSVIATGLTEMEDLRDLKNVSCHTLNICDHEQCVGLAQQLKDQSTSIWALVNNAGFINIAPFEVVSREVERSECDVLFHGHLDVTRSFLPLMVGRQVNNEVEKWSTSQRRKKISKNGAANGGRIVNISSLAGACPAPNWSRYSSMKCAIRWWSHSLRNEVSPRFGIWATAIMPGLYGTPILSKSLASFDRAKENASPEIREAYNLDRLGERLKSYDAKPNTNDDELYETMIHAILGVHPLQEYPVGWPAGILIPEKIRQFTDAYL